MDSGRKGVFRRWQTSGFKGYYLSLGAWCQSTSNEVKLRSQLGKECLGNGRPPGATGEENNKEKGPEEIDRVQEVQCWLSQSITPFLWGRNLHTSLISSSHLWPDSFHVSSKSKGPPPPFFFSRTVESRSSKRFLPFIPKLKHSSFRVRLARDSFHPHMAGFATMTTVKSKQVQKTV